MEPRPELGSELESFRQQWLSDLRSRTDAPGTESASNEAQPAPASRPAAAPQKPPGPAPPSSARRPALTDEDEQYVRGPSFDDEPPRAGRTLADPEPPPEGLPARQLVSALDHYEEAMEKEAQGNMGDSLKLYRKAYRLDHGVDKRYREKHFPAATTTTTTTTAVLRPASSAPSAPLVPSSPSTSSKDAPSKDPPPPQDAASSKDDAPDARPRSLAQLIASFASARTQPAPPAVEGDPPPPCPIARLPDELLVHVLADVAVDDVGDFVRLAQVCRHLAYLVANEQRIWRRVCLGAEFGFAGMHYRWERSVEWEPLDDEDELPLDGDEGADGDEAEKKIIISPSERAELRRRANLQTTLSLTPSVYASWLRMFRARPRLRFNGCYISTVNYVRTGQASTNQSVWGGSPIHIVTYYRYLRFLRDGTAVSLLTTAAPADVVHHLSPDALVLHRGGAHAHLPSAVVQGALRGRWHLGSVADHRPASAAGAATAATAAAAAAADQEGDVFVETEGVGTKYVYRMDLTLRSAGKGVARNNKLSWRGFYSYNKLTDDWAEFGLKNDKPFFFSRVKSYGNGE